MEHVDIREDSGVKYLRLLHRSPFDVHAVIKGFRLHVNDSDLVAGIDIEFDSCSGLLEVFNHNHEPPYAASWTSPDGEWQIDIKCSASGRRIVTSQVTSQLLHHPWFIRTSLEVEPPQFHGICDSVRCFVGKTD